MSFLKHSSIKKRLTVIIMGISSVSVLLTTFAISVSSVYDMRDNIIKELDGLASIAGKSNDAALSFDEYGDVAKNLNGFGAKPSIVQVCLYDAFAIPLTGEAKSNFLVDRYAKPDVAPDKKCPENLDVRTVITNDSVQLMREVMSDGKVIGALYIEARLDEIDEYIYKQINVALMVSIIAIFVSYLLESKLQRSISHPLLGLSETARQVSIRKDYSIRAPLLEEPGTPSNNELVILTDSFNEMLSEIEFRNDQLKKQNTELEKAKDLAESANRAKSHFLANISHELRTPLNAVIGFSSILMNQLFGPLGDQKYLEYAKDINESGAHLLDIINDILDLSKAEAGKLILNYEEIHIGKAINKCLTIVAERAEKGKVTINSEVSKMLPSLVADRLRFIQIVLNILSNAVKFTPEGGNVSVMVRSDELGQLVLSVKDTGIGMSQAHIDQAFQSFGQVDSGLNRKYEGTGLGLPLTKKLMELHHGHIAIESELGKGTLVTLTFPIQPPGGIGDDQL